MSSSIKEAMIQAARKEKKDSEFLKRHKALKEEAEKEEKPWVQWSAKDKEMEDLSFILKRQTEKAYLFTVEDGKEAWVPKSLCKDAEENKDVSGVVIVSFQMRHRTAKEKGLL